MADSIARSTEALNRRVDQLYRQFLQRDADASKSALVSYLQGGGTVEAIIAGLVASQEYRLLFGSDGAFVQSLYTGLIGRTGSNAEVAAQVAMVQSNGRAAVASAFLSSAEYRGVQVRRFYARLLNRPTPPLPAEVDGWVNMALDLLRIEIQFAGSAEFQANG